MKNETRLKLETLLIELEAVQMIRPRVGKLLDEGKDICSREVFEEMQKLNGIYGCVGSSVSGYIDALRDILRVVNLDRIAPNVERRRKPRAKRAA